MHRIAPMLLAVALAACASQSTQEVTGSGGAGAGEPEGSGGYGGELPSTSSGDADETTTASTGSEPAADACATCLGASCAVQQSACASEPDCGAVDQCLAACAPDDGGCVFGCAGAHPAGWKVFFALTVCDQHHCGAPCGTAAEGCGLADLPYLAGNPACGDCQRASCCEPGLSCGEDVACNDAAGCALACVAQQPGCPANGIDGCKAMPGWGKWQALQDCGGASCSFECGGGGGPAPECTKSSDCTDPTYPVCAPDGTCAECASDAGCKAIDPSYPYCVEYFCTECVSNADCGGLACIDNYCE